MVLGDVFVKKAEKRQNVVTRMDGTFLDLLYQETGEAHTLAVYEQVMEV